MANEHHAAQMPGGSSAMEYGQWQPMVYAQHSQPTVVYMPISSAQSVPLPAGSSLECVEVAPALVQQTFEGIASTCAVANVMHERETLGTNIFVKTPEEGGPASRHAERENITHRTLIGLEGGGADPADNLLDTSLGYASSEASTAVSCSARRRRVRRVAKAIARELLANPESFVLLAAHECGSHVARAVLKSHGDCGDMAKQLLFAEADRVKTSKYGKRLLDDM